MKYLLSFFFVFCLLFTGCSGVKTPPEDTLCLQVQLCDNGKVTQTIEIPTFSEENNQDYLKDLVSNIEKKIYNNYYIAYYIAGLKSGEDLKDITFTKPYYDKGSQKVKFSFQFSNQKVLSSINQTGGELCLSFLEIARTEKDFPFFEKNKDGVMVCEYYIDIVKQVYNKYFDKKFDGGVLLEYRYIMPYKNIHSNADFENGNSHSWIAKMGGSVNEKKIELWIVQPNRGMWYLGIIILMASVYFIVYLVFNKKSLFTRKNRLKIKNIDKKS